ncbi:MAG: hypothetical protein ACJAR2_002484 [Ilumatobacter sp.]|jgi:hypothetical protein
MVMFLVVSWTLLGVFAISAELTGIPNLTIDGGPE